MQTKRLWSVLPIAAMLLLVMGLLAACTGDDDDDADGDVRPITATPTGVLSLPEDILEETVIIEDGSFDVQSVRAIAEQPVMITMANRDDETYTFEIEDLVTETEIPAATEIFVNFNAPNTGEYEGVLRNADGDEVSTIFINVEGPGGT
jgi:hypothetical protein